MIRRPPRSTQGVSSAASDVYKRQANYSGGIIITDWYSEEGNANDSVKIPVRFLSNEIRSDAVDIDVFYKNCISVNNCSISKKDGPLKKELTRKILSKATIYKKQSKDKNFKPYEMGSGE